ncbi:hypothetical protein [Arthrobacter sp. GAS37]|uniref:hypothetical protein n=1 Tax=Arthrobacter sp. GAS37 TaxID=3156261 RepID=UPI00384E5F98
MATDASSRPPIHRDGLAGSENPGADSKGDETTARGKITGMASAACARTRTIGLDQKRHDRMTTPQTRATTAKKKESRTILPFSGPAGAVAASHIPTQPSSTRVLPATMDTGFAFRITRMNCSLPAETAPPAIIERQCLPGVNDSVSGSPGGSTFDHL